MVPQVKGVFKSLGCPDMASSHCWAGGPQRKNQHHLGTFSGISRLESPSLQDRACSRHHIAEIPQCASGAFCLQAPHATTHPYPAQAQALHQSIPCPHPPLWLFFSCFPRLLSKSYQLFKDLPWLSLSENHSLSCWTGQ